jgi:signal transduction histidine kinase/CheY-like chemotaxis protein
MKREIIIVEDEAPFRRVIKQALRGRGLTFHEADSVGQGVTLLDSVPDAQVVLLDLAFPGDDGTRLLEHIKERSSKYRVIVLTGHDEKLAAEKAAGYNVFSYLAKAEESANQYLIFEVEKAFWDLERVLLTERMDKHLEIQRQITSDAALDQVLNLTCKGALELVEGYACHIRLLDLQKGDFELVGCQARFPDARAAFRARVTTDDVFSGRVAKSGKSENVPDLQTDPDFLEMKRQMLAGGDTSEDVRTYLDRVKSAYIVPISTKIFESEVDAVFNISSAVEGYFDDAERRRLVDEFVTQVEIAVTKNWLDIRRKEIHEDYSKSSQLLVRVSETENDLDGIYDIVFEGISKIVNPEMISIFRYDERSERLKNVAEYRGGRRVRDVNEVFGPEESLTGKVFARGETIRLPNPPDKTKPTEDGRYDPSNEQVHLKKIPSRAIEHYLAVPMKIGDKPRPVGVIRLVNKKSAYYHEYVSRGERDEGRVSRQCLLERGFSRDCQTVLEIIANHLAVALENAGLVGRLSWTISQLKTLTQVVRRISSDSEGSLDNLLSLIVRKTAEVLHAEVCMLFLKEEQGDEITLKECHGMPMMQGISYKLGEGKTGTVALTGEPILESKAEKEHAGKYNDLVSPHLRPDETGEREIKSFMAVPIITLERRADEKRNGEDGGAVGRAPSEAGGTYSEEEKIIGVLKVFNKTEDGFLFDPDDLNIFATFASQIGVALALAERHTDLSDLVGGVCHEIRGKLGTVQLNIDLVKEAMEASDGNPLVGQITDKISRVTNATSQARVFVKDLLAFSASHFEHRQQLDINTLVKEAVGEIQANSNNIKNVENIETVKDYFPGEVVCDVYKTPFIHIIQNIVINAYEAMDKNQRGTLTVTTSKDASGKTAFVTISDTGKGIGEEDLPNIYKAKFYKKPGGNGLGLWLVKKYLPKMDGIIAVKSRLNHGTTFTIQLPTVSPESQEGQNE